MTVSSYTPGPWIADGWYVGPKDLPTLVKVNPNGPIGREEIIANARLIAAAPDLLTALQALVKAVETYTNATPEDWPELAAARAALDATAPLRERLCTPMTVGEASAAASTVL